MFLFVKSIFLVNFICASEQTPSPVRRRKVQRAEIINIQASASKQIIQPHFDCPSYGSPGDGIPWDDRLRSNIVVFFSGIDSEKKDT